MTSPAKSPPPHSTNPIHPIRLIGPRLPGSPRRPILPPIPQFGIPSLGLPPCCPDGMKTSFRPKIGQIEKFMSLSMTPGHFLAAEVGGGEGFRVAYSVLPAWKREGAGLDLKGRDRDEGDGDGDEDEDGEMEGSEKDEDEGPHQEEGLEIEEEGEGVDRVVEWVDSLVDHYDGFAERGDREDQEDQVGLFDQGLMERTRDGGGIMQLHPDLVAGLEALELEWDEDFVDDKEGGLDAASDSGLGTLDEEGSQADEAGDEDNFDDDDQDDETEEELEALLEVLPEDLTLDEELAEEKHEPLVEDEKMKQGYLRYAVAPLKRKFGH
ncbi:Protein of unknown function [Pyronema omphalodes CBS 100304]|uniref:Uncharacterized protein n=1 Tax=Pyronema omphalodes (strain CBS 100304) TaxID=1076935 RepID=U4KUV2_PYROM|nr:Protein of unknown function [Pyronema omphalodes CBS 100304]